MFRIASPSLPLLFGTLLLCVAALANAANPINTLEPGLFGRQVASDTAIRGYDTVAYFTQGRPVMGQDAYVHEWQGAKWKFASAAHRDLFKANPARYAPQYGGYCAYGVSSNYLVKIEPEAFSIVNDKLYLNYNTEVQTLWSADTAGLIRKADANLPGLMAP